MRRGSSNPSRRSVRRGEPARPADNPGSVAPEGPSQGRGAGAPLARPLSVAERVGGIAGAGRARRRLSDRGPAPQHLGPVSLQARRRRAGAGQGGHRRAGGADRRLRLGAGHGAGLQRIAQRRLRQGHAARGAPAGAVGVSPCSRAGLALSSRAPHRRIVAGDRARHRRHRVPAVLSAVQHRPDLCRNPAGLRHPVAALQLDLCRRHLGDDRALHRLYLSGDRLAGALSPRHERAQQRGQHQGDRQPVELRDRQIFRQ